MTVVAFGLAAGVVWEVLEWFVIDLQWWDTATDLVADTIGATIAAVFVAWKVDSESGRANQH